MADLAVLAARFGARLRAEGLPVGPERSARFAAAVTLADPRTVGELYWCGLATLVGDPAEIPTYDRVFAVVFGGGADLAESRGDPESPPFRAGSDPAPTGSDRPQSGSRRSGAMAETADTSTRDVSGPDSESPIPALAAAAERLGHRDFATLSSDELARLVAVMRRLRLATPLRRSRRYEA